MVASFKPTNKELSDLSDLHLSSLYESDVIPAAIAEVGLKPNLRHALSHVAFMFDSAAAMSDVKNESRPGMIQASGPDAPAPKPPMMANSILLFHDYDTLRSTSTIGPALFPHRFIPIYGDGDCGPRSLLAAAFPRLFLTAERDRLGQATDPTSRAEEKQLCEFLRANWKEMIDKLISAAENPDTIDSPNSEGTRFIYKQFLKKENISSLESIFPILQDMRSNYCSKGKWTSKLIFSLCAPILGKTIRLAYPMVRSIPDDLTMGFNSRSSFDDFYNGIVLSPLSHMTYFPNEEAAKKGWSFDDPNRVQRQMLVLKTVSHWDLLVPAPDLFFFVNHPSFSSDEMKQLMPSIMHPISPAIGNRSFSLPYVFLPSKTRKKQALFIRQFDILDYQNLAGVKNARGMVLSILLTGSPFNERNRTSQVKDDRFYKALDVLSDDYDPSIALVVLPVQFLRTRTGKEYVPSFEHSNTLSPKAITEAEFRKQQLDSKEFSELLVTVTPKEVLNVSQLRMKNVGEADNSAGIVSMLDIKNYVIPPVTQVLLARNLLDRIEVHLMEPGKGFLVHMNKNAEGGEQLQQELFQFYDQELKNYKETPDELKTVLGALQKRVSRQAIARLAEAPFPLKTLQAVRDGIGFHQFFRLPESEKILARLEHEETFHDIFGRMLTVNEMSSLVRLFSPEIHSFLPLSGKSRNESIANAWQDLWTTDARVPRTRYWLDKCINENRVINWMSLGSREKNMGMIDEKGYSLNFDRDSFDLIDLTHADAKTDARTTRSAATSGSTDSKAGKPAMASGTQSDSTKAPGATSGSTDLKVEKPAMVSGTQSDSTKAPGATPGSTKSKVEKPAMASDTQSASTKTPGATPGSTKSKVAKPAKASDTQSASTKAPGATSDRKKPKSRAKNGATEEDEEESEDDEDYDDNEDDEDVSSRRL